MVTTNYIAKGVVSVNQLELTVTPIDVVILTAPTRRTVVKTLELLNNGDYDAIVHIKRKDTNNVTYQDIKIDMVPKQRIILWDGYHVINTGHKLVLSSDNEDVECSANVYEDFIV